MPDESTILHFRHLLEQHELAVAIFAEVNAVLSEKGLSMKRGSVVDATLIAAPSSTKNQDKQRDPEMSQTKKGNQWYFGMTSPYRRRCRKRPDSYRRMHHRQGRRQRHAQRLPAW